MKGFSRFAFLGWFITSFPRTSKVIVILATVAILVAMYTAAVKQ
jgi:hypothetical protein